MKDDETMTIRQMCEEFDVTPRTLRFYETKELLSPVREGQKRLYSNRERARLKLILRGKRLGWSLSEIRESFDLYDSSHDESAQLESMLGKLEQRRATLIAQRSDIDSALQDLERVETNARRALREVQSGNKRRRA